MGRIVFIFIFISLGPALSACDQNLKAGSPSRSFPPGEAVVTIQSRHSFSSTTHYRNQSERDFVRCRRDRESNVYLEARRFVKNDGGGVDDRMIILFFPLRGENLNGAAVDWQKNSVQLFGKWAPFKSLGGHLQGTCHATLQWSEPLLSGEILCRDFVNTDPGGIGRFDLQISPFTCVLSAR